MPTAETPDEAVNSSHMLNIKEASLLASTSYVVSENSVETLLGQEVIPSYKVRWHGRKKRAIPVRSVYFLMLRTMLETVTLSREVQAHLANWVLSKPSRKLFSSRYKLDRGITLYCGEYLEELTATREKTISYMHFRNRIVHSDPEIRGGAPIIKGTRLSVHSLLERHEDGDTVEELCEDYPELGLSTIEAALLYAKANPRNGRPVARPWRDNAEAVH